MDGTVSNVNNHQRGTTSKAVFGSAFQAADLIILGKENGWIIKLYTFIM